MIKFVEWCRLTLILGLVATFIAACTAEQMYGDFTKPKDKYSPPPFDTLVIGDTQDQVMAKLGPPDTHLASQVSGGHTLETWEYVQYEAIPGFDRVYRRYEVVFRNGHLAEWRAGSDDVHELRHN